MVHARPPALRVLAADGDPRARRTLADELEALGCAVTQAASRGEVLDRVGAEPFALAICDLALAGGGLELLTRVLAEQPALSVVVTAAHPGMQTVVEAVRLGARDYLPKPLTSGQIRRLVSEERDRAAALGAAGVRTTPVTADVGVEGPPLRSRPGDILGLARSFAERFARQRGVPIPSFSPAARRLLVTWPWPGDVRELREVVERAISVAPGAVLGADAFPEWMAVRTCDSPFVGAPLTAEELEREHVTRVVAWASTFAEAARVLGMDPSTLRRKLKRWEEARGGDDRAREGTSARTPG